MRTIKVRGMTGLITGNKIKIMKKNNKIEEDILQCARLVQENYGGWDERQHRHVQLLEVLLTLTLEDSNIALDGATTMDLYLGVSKLIVISPMLQLSAATSPAEPSSACRLSVSAEPYSTDHSAG